MRIKTSTIKYIVNNFFYLIPLVLIPTACMTFFFNPFKPLVFFQQLAKNGYRIDSWFGDVYRYFSIVNYNNVLLWLACVVLALCSLSVVLSSTERHMRLGVRNYRHLFRMFNDSVLYVLPVLLLFLIINEVFAVIVSGLIVLFSMFVSGVWLEVLAGVVWILSSLLFIGLFVFSCCTVPSMISDGYKFNVALSYSISLVQNKFWQTFFSFVATYLASLVIMCLVFYFLNPAFYVIKFLFLLVWLMFLPVFCMRKYVEFTGGDRKDIESSVFDR